MKSNRPKPQKRRFTWPRPEPSKWTTKPSPPQFRGKGRISRFTFDSPCFSLGRGPSSSTHFQFTLGRGPDSSIHFQFTLSRGPDSSIHFSVRPPPPSFLLFTVQELQGPIGIRNRIQGEDTTACQKPHLRRACHQVLLESEALAARKMQLPCAEPRMQNT